MNTTIRNTALASILFAAASGAFAAESADLTVKGVIKPAACVPTLTGGGIFDFGTISASALSDTAAYTLPVKKGSVTVTCDAATKVAVTFADNRTGTANQSAAAAVGYFPTWIFGAGSVAGKNVGAFAISYGSIVGQATGDGSEVTILYSHDKGASGNWSVLPNATSYGVIPDATAISFAAWGNSKPNAYKTVVLPINVELAVGKVSELPPLTQEVPIDGSATIAVKYL